MAVTGLQFGYAFRLFVGALYVAMHAVWMKAITQVPLVAALAIVSIWAVCVMAIFAPLCERFLMHRSGEIRFGISSIFLAMVVCSLYLTPISWLIRSTMRDIAGGEEYGVLLLLIPFALFWIWMTAMVLISFADGLLRAYMALVRREQQPTGQGERHMDRPADD